MDIVTPTELYNSLEKLLVQCVDLIKRNGMMQRSKAWELSMGITVGGSEIAAVLGMNPYSSRQLVIETKANILMGYHSFFGGEACDWGSLFEEIIGMYVEIDLGGKIYGDNVCIQKYVGHRNSPDGYIVAKYYYDEEDDEYKLLTTDLEHDVEFAYARIILLEFKCPHGRKPDGIIPKQYIPQLWSGLAVSPFAEGAMFVDASFKKCSLDSIGCNYMFDTIYHKTSLSHPNKLPIAWGVIGIYSENAGDYSYVSQFNKNAVIPNCKLIDFGKMDKFGFIKCLASIKNKKYRIEVILPSFADGRGEQRFKTPSDYVNELAQKSGDDYFIGVLPWKLFEVCYATGHAHSDFTGVILPEITRVHDDVKKWLENCKDNSGETSIDTNNDLDDLYG